MINVMLIPLCLFIVSLAEHISDFQPGEFWKWKQDTFYEVIHGAEFKDTEGLFIVDMGDVNNDKTTDLISLSENRRGFGVHYYLTDEDVYESVFYELNECEIQTLSFVPLDFQLMATCKLADTGDYFLQIKLFNDEEEDDDLLFQAKEE